MLAHTTQPPEVGFLHCHPGAVGELAMPAAALAAFRDALPVSGYAIAQPAITA